jgi:hypothetical protein
LCPEGLPFASWPLFWRTKDTRPQGGEQAEGP